jgi:hypothetical protein
MSDLSRPQHLDRIREFQRASSNPQAMKALEELVTQNLGFQLFRTIEQTKRDLSKSIVAKLDFEHGPIKIHEMITRDRFELMIAKELAAVEEGVHQVVEEAGLTPDDIDVVLRTGGSSAVPVFVNMLSGIFSEDKLMQLEPLVSVVGGMAVIAQQNERPIPPYTMRYETPGNPILSNIEVDSEVPAERYYFHVDEPAYIGDAFRINRIPTELSGMPSIRVAAADMEAFSETFLSFDVHRTVRVYVGYESTAIERPRWLRDWQRDEKTIEIADDWRSPRILKLYSKIYEPGTVMLGGNKARGFAGDIPINYIVIVKALL